MTSSHRKHVDVVRPEVETSRDGVATASCRRLTSSVSGRYTSFSVVDILGPTSTSSDNTPAGYQLRHVAALIGHCVVLAARSLPLITCM